MMSATLRVAYLLRAKRERSAQDPGAYYLIRPLGESEYEALVYPVYKKHARLTFAVTEDFDCYYVQGMDICPHPSKRGRYDPQAQPERFLFTLT